MTTEELINEISRQGIKANDKVKIRSKEQLVIGRLTDAKVHAADDHYMYDRIGFILEPPFGKTIAPIPQPINVEEIDSINIIK